MAQTRLQTLRKWSLVLGVASVGAITAYAFIVVVDGPSPERGADVSRVGPGAGDRESGPPAVAANARLGRGAPRRPFAGSADAPPGGESEPPPSHQQLVAEALEVATAEEDAFVARFDSEPVEGTWASTWESRLGARLRGSLAGLSGFKDLTVECRSQRCLAEASWADYGAATSALDRAANATKGDCATFVFMPPPEDRAGGYAHKIRFESCQAPPG